jgi:hypothetical protein
MTDMRVSATEAATDANDGNVLECCLSQCNIDWALCANSGHSAHEKINV